MFNVRLIFAFVVYVKSLRNVKIRFKEHESRTDKNWECFKDLQEHLSHDFQWSEIAIAPRNTLK